MLEVKVRATDESNKSWTFSFGVACVISAAQGVSESLWDTWYHTYGLPSLSFK